MTDSGQTASGQTDGPSTGEAGDRDERTRIRYEEFTVAGSELLEQVKRLIQEGNVRRVFIKNSEGRTLLEIPLNAGVAITVVTAAFAPVLVAVGAVAAMLSQVTIGVERLAPEEAPDPQGTDPVTGTAPDEPGAPLP